MSSQFLAKKSRAIKRSVQRGVTLIELSVVIVILSLLAFALYQFADPGGRGKAVAILSYANETANALQRFKQDTGCYPRQIQDLYTPVSGTIAAGNTFCGIAIPAVAWNGPYLKPAAISPAGANCASADKLSPGATVCVSRQGTATPYTYVISVNGMPAELVSSVLKECNGTAAAVNGTFTAGKCRVGAGGVSTTASAGTALPTTGSAGNVDILFDVVN